MRSQKLTIPWLFIGLWTALSPASSPLRAQSALQAWVVPALTRVGRNDPAGNQREISLWAARGEYESFQVVVRAAGSGLKNVTVEISDLFGKVIFTGTTNSENQFQIDAHQLVSGMYVLRAIDEQRHTASLKWMKEWGRSLVQEGGMREFACLFHLEYSRC